MISAVLKFLFAVFLPSPLLLMFFVNAVKAVDIEIGEVQPVVLCLFVVVDTVALFFRTTFADVAVAISLVPYGRP
eukprot:scaffold385689_cov14-Prasinocladus_malaysianus.AAC.1